MPLFAFSRNVEILQKQDMENGIKSKVYAKNVEIYA